MSNSGSAKRIADSDWLLPCFGSQDKLDESASPFNPFHAKKRHYTAQPPSITNYPFHPIISPVAVRSHHLGAKTPSLHHFRSFSHFNHDRVLKTQERGA